MLKLAALVMKITANAENLCFEYKVSSLKGEKHVKLYKTRPGELVVGRIILPDIYFVLVIIFFRNPANSLNKWNFSLDIMNFLLSVRKV